MYGVAVTLGNQNARIRPQSEIAALKARFICRNNIRSTFWDSMQQAGGEAGDLAFTLFDKQVISTALSSRITRTDWS